MLLTKEQISEQMRKHAEKKNGLHDLMEIMIESMMVAERGEFLADNPGNKGNGTVLDPPMDRAENWSSAYHATDTATSSLRYSLSCATRKKNVTDSRESFIPRDLRRSG